MECNTAACLSFTAVITLSAPSCTDTGGFWIALAALVASTAALDVAIWLA
jgi:hypothetical protein